MQRKFTTKHFNFKNEMVACHLNHPYLIVFMRKKIELDSESANTEVPCTFSRSTSELPEIPDIGRYVNVRITENDLKYNLLIKTHGYHFQITISLLCQEEN